MVSVSDPYQFILSESVVSSSQEDLLKRIPGWDDAALNYSFTPSQPLLAASPQLDISKVSASANSAFDDTSSQGEPVKYPYELEGPLELMSPETEQGNEGDSYDAAVESDRSQSPCCLGQLSGLAVADLFPSGFMTQPQGASENVFESEPSMLKGMSQVLKTDEIPAKFRAAKIGGRGVDCVTKGGLSREPVFKIRELGLGSESFVPDSVVPVETIGPRDGEKTRSTGLHRKTTTAKKCAQVLQPKQACHLSTSSELSPAIGATEECTEDARLDTRTSADENCHENKCGQQRRDLSCKDANAIRPDTAANVAEDPLFRTSVDDVTKLKSTSISCVSVRKREANSRKRSMEKEKFDSAVSMHKVKAPKHVTGIQEQTETFADAVNNERLPAVVTKVAPREFQNSDIKKLGGTANNGTLKPVSVEKCQLQQPTCSAVSLEGQDSGRSMMPSVTDLKCITRTTGKVERGKTCLGRSGGDNKPSPNDKDVMTFPESVMDVVMLCSGCLPLCKPDEPDLLSLVIRSGVTLPLPFCRGKLR